MEEEDEGEDNEVEQPVKEEGGKQGGRKTHGEEEAERLWPWIKQIAPGHPLTDTELPQDIALLTYVSTRSEFVARFETDDFPQNYPRGLRLHQKTRSSKPSTVGSDHEAFRIVLLWLWQKYAVFTQGEGEMPSHVTKILEPRQGLKLSRCPACARGDCKAMVEEVAMAMIGNTPLVSSSGAPQTTESAQPPQSCSTSHTAVLAQAPTGAQAHPQGQSGLRLRLPMLASLSAAPGVVITRSPGNGDCLFTSLAFIRCGADNKPWPADILGQQRMGALCRTWYLLYAKHLVDKDRIINDIPIRTLLTDNCGHASVEEYFDLMRNPTPDNQKTWGSWLEMAICARKWDICIAVFWHVGQEAELRCWEGNAKGPEQRRGAVLFNRSHYDALTLSPAAWALVDGTS